jgi:hypothetical protein
MPRFICAGCDEECESEDSYSDCCNEPAVPAAPRYSTLTDPDGYDRNGAYDGFQVVSDAEGGF